ncbi:MAG: aquaporin [Burkholderiaceae bacterium]
MPWRTALRRHWPEYLIEAGFLLIFVTVAGMVATLLESASSPLRNALPNALSRHLLNGATMGLTTMALVYSPWGRRSGAHLNPAITLAFFRLRKVSRWDLLCYVAAQFIGGAAGIVLVRATMAPAFAESAAPAAIATTLTNQIVVFALEFAFAVALMLLLLSTTNHPRLRRWTGAFYGLLIAGCVTFASPLSAFGVNPARTIAVALTSGTWNGALPALIAPILGMLLAVDAYRLLTGRTQVMCAKLSHNVEGRCIFRCQHPAQARAIALEAFNRRLQQPGS